MDRFERAAGEAVAAGGLPGLAAITVDAGGTRYEGAWGWADVEAGTPLRLDSLLLVASMTKPVTSVAIMQLVERGQLDLDGDAGAILPGLAGPQVLRGFDPASGEPLLEPASGPVTIRQLLTHTSGLAYNLWNADLARYMEHAGVPSMQDDGPGSLEVPLVADPGTRWEYGISTDRLGQVVEAVSGQGLDEYFERHILGPLGMADTAFAVPAEKAARRATVHRRTEDGALAPFPLTSLSDPAFCSGGGGLISTPADYGRFLRMLLRGGELDGARVLAPETVALVGRNHIADLEVRPLPTAMPFLTNDLEILPGITKQWGLGFQLNAEPVPGGRSAGSLAWAGLANTYFWVDPTAGLAGATFTQLFPFADGDALDLLGEFERAVYRNLTP